DPSRDAGRGPAAADQLRADVRPRAGPPAERARPAAVLRANGLGLRGGSARLDVDLERLLEHLEGLVLAALVLEQLRQLGVDVADISAGAVAKVLGGQSVELDGPLPLADVGERVAEQGVATARIAAVDLPSRPD